MQQHGWAFVTVVLVASGMAQRTSAQEDWGVVVNGRAIHVNAARHWNEDNWGLGFEREFDGGGRWVKVALANGFRDSDERPSYMAGGGLKRRFHAASGLYLDVGVVGFLMTREDVNHNRPFPGALPAMTFGAKHVALNVTYMPDSVVDHVTKANLHDPAMRGLFFIQLKLDASLFGWHGRHPAITFADSSK